MTTHGFENAADPTPLLLIDDDKSMASLLSECCMPMGFSITSARNGEEGLRLLSQQFFVLVILDVNLGGIDGFEVLKRLRLSSNVPVLMLTGRGTAPDRIRGLRIGADDYLPKPFQTEELIARIESILRRTNPEERAVRITVGDVTLDTQEHSVMLLDRKLELTGAEFSLFHLLLRHPGEVISKEELIFRVFRREPTIFDRSIDNLVNHLRRKLGPHPNSSDRIKNIRAIGYSYVLPSEQPAGE